VPDVRGQTAEAAGRLLKRARLRLEIIQGRRDVGTADAIIEQKPSPGERVPPGSTVGVVLAAAPTLIAVPDVRGRSLEDAGRLLARSRLQMAIRDRRAGDGPPNSVADQTPAAGNLVPPGATVGVVVLVPPAPPPGGTSGGGTRPPPEPPRVTVPEVRGRTVDAASQILERSRLQLEISQRRENAGAVGTVIDQSPAAGERVAPGSTVGVVLAVAPRLIAVPDVRGRPVEEATRILSRSRLRLRVADRRPGDGPPDTVIEQRPVPESRVAPGSTVSVAVLAPLAPSPGGGSGQPLVVGPPSGGVGPLVPPSPGRPGPGAPPGSGQPRTPTPPNGDRPASGTPIAPPITDRPTVSTPSTPVVTESTPAPAGGNTAPTPGTQSGVRLAIIVGVTLLVGLGAGIGLTRGWQSKRLQVGTAPVVRMMASPDLGLPEVKATSGPAVSIDVRLRPHPDPGQQTIITNGAAALGEARSG
jgi:beta-lactam-binding protein with PASTA domain